MFKLGGDNLPRAVLEQLYNYSMFYGLIHGGMSVQNLSIKLCADVTNILIAVQGLEDAKLVWCSSQFDERTGKVRITFTGATQFVENSLTFIDCKSERVHNVASELGVHTIKS